MYACFGFNPDYSQEEPSLEEIRELAGPALLEFGTPWCGHCRKAAPAMHQVLATHAELPHIKVYDGKGRPLGRAFGVKRWPTLILLHDGAEVDRLVRPREPGEIEQWLARAEPGLSHLS